MYKTIPFRRRHSFLIRGLAITCATLFLSACAHDHDATEEAAHCEDHQPPQTSMAYESDFFVPETTMPIETGVSLSSLQESVDLEQLVDDVSITITKKDGHIGEYDFFTCNETQLFGDYSIFSASYQDEEYLMLSHNGIVLLAKEDGSNAKLFYDQRRLDLSFPCHFNMNYDFLALHEGDFLQNGGRQLALVIPMENGSGIDVEQLRLIDLDNMTEIPLYTQEPDYEENLYRLFEEHFAGTGMSHPYSLFQYVQYSILDGLIFVEYGACNDDYHYISFLQGSLSPRDGTMILDPAVTFHDEN